MYPVSRSLAFTKVVLGAAILAVSLFADNVMSSEAVNAGSQTITVAMTQEPPNLNSMRMTDLVSFFVIGHVNEGLLRYDKRGRLSAGVAERWEVTQSRMVFWLRADAAWANGSPVTAHDFVYAWRRVNDPQEAAPFAAIMYPIKNAEKIQKGELPVENLGVRAEDDNKLVVDLERPCGYCLSLVSHGTFFPVQQAFHEKTGERFGAEASHLLANGPFMMTDWVHEASLVLKKNPHYWDAENIHLNQINVGYITADNRTRLNLFRDGSIALVRLGAETVKDALSEGMRLRTFSSGGVAYIWFNLKDDRPTANLHLRKAIQASFDPEVYVNQVIAIPGYRPTRTLFPAWIRGESGSFVKQHPPKQVPRGKEVAEGHMAQFRETYGDDALAPLRLLTVASPTGTKVAEYFQGLMKQTLGLDMLVDQQTFKQYLSKARAGEFDLVFSSWYPDFDDLVTYADLLGSYNANNRGGYVSAEYDQLLDLLQSSTDEKERFNAAARMQEHIVTDVPLLPMAETGSAYLVHPKLKGVVRRVIGQDPDYTYARVVD